MRRKEFLKNTLLGTCFITTSETVVKALQPENPLEKLHQEPIGFNHIPPSKPIKMEHMIIHKSNTRGHSNLGWLDSYHTFSFANYYNPERMNFGVLRVLNDDKVSEGMGFGTHPHDNMEIVSIPLFGDLEHKDSMGNTTVIKQGDIQVMSAGTGVYHSEYNKNKDKEVRFLQIWILPNKRNVQPRYDQLSLDISNRHNKWQQILSPNPDDEGVWIYQDAWFNMSRLDEGCNISYQLQKEGNGMYVFVLNGKVRSGDQVFGTRDGFGVWNTPQIHFESLEGNTELLLMELPMNAM